MAEKGIIVADSATGESVACRDAVENDNDGNARIIQRVDVCKGKLPDTFYSSTYKVWSAINSATPSSWVENGNSDWTTMKNNLVDVGDKSTLVVAIDCDDEPASLPTIMPLIYASDETTLLWPLEPKTFSLAENPGETVTLKRANDQYILLPETWDVTGAMKIGIRVSDYSDAYTTLDVYATVI